MPAINSIKGIAPGKIVYHVYGSVIAKGKGKGKPNAKQAEEYVEKIIITSFPKNWHTNTKSRSSALFFDVLRESGWDGKDWHSAHSVRDCGIGGHKYNLNRIFATRVEAIEFASECLSGNFFDNEDQAVYNRMIDDFNDFLGIDF